MAYRSKKRKSSAPRKRTTRKGSRRRRMGAAPAGGRRGRIMKVAATLAGIVGAKYINKIPGVDKIDSKLLAGIVIAAGYFVPGFLPAKFRPIAEGVGDGLMIAGGLSLLSDFGVLNGIPIVAGFRDLSAVNGVEEKRVTHKTFTESANDEVFRPSVSQIMNGYYYRRNKDGRR